MVRTPEQLTKEIDRLHENQKLDQADYEAGKLTASELKEINAATQMLIESAYRRIDELTA